MPISLNEYSIGLYPYNDRQLFVRFIVKQHKLQYDICFSP